MNADSQPIKLKMNVESSLSSHAKIQSYRKTKNNFLTGLSESHSALSLHGKKREKIKTPGNIYIKKSDGLSGFVSYPVAVYQVFVNIISLSLQLVLTKTIMLKNRFIVLKYTKIN